MTITEEPSVVQPVEIDLSPEIEGAKISNRFEKWWKVKFVTAGIVGGATPVAMGASNVSWVNGWNQLWAIPVGILAGQAAWLLPTNISRTIRFNLAMSRAEEHFRRGDDSHGLGRILRTAASMTRMPMGTDSFFDANAFGEADVCERLEWVLQKAFRSWVDKGIAARWKELLHDEIAARTFIADGLLNAWSANTVPVHQDRLDEFALLLSHALAVAVAEDSIFDAAQKVFRDFPHDKIADPIVEAHSLLTAAQGLHRTQNAIVPKEGQISTNVAYSMARSRIRNLRDTAHAEEKEDLAAGLTQYLTAAEIGLDVVNRQDPLYFGAPNVVLERTLEAAGISATPVSK